MREIDHPPDAASLMESMRSIGYTLDSALADLLDNSISANASQIDIEFRPSDDPYLAIIDDGFGMNSAELERAMRHGSQNPLAIRGDSDLGRYGLGLKTASFSQCRCFTVVSKKEGATSACRWDLDVVAARNSWTLLVLDESEIASLPHIEELIQRSTGTIVLWQKLDRLNAGESSFERAMGEKMFAAGEHLSLVFHRYISGEPGIRKVKISINKNPLDPIDPFLLAHRATQRLDEDVFRIEQSKVSVKPFILPHISKLSPEDMTTAGGREGLRSQQGFYIYRRARLIIWGTWFRLARKDELSKLARVRVDIPNSLDHLWTLDIKKSAAHPPEAVRNNLSRTVERITGSSSRTIAFRGRATSLVDATPVWVEIKDRDGVRYDINRSHPAISNFIQACRDGGLEGCNAILKIIESSFPADALYSNMAADKRPLFKGDLEAKEIRRLISDVAYAVSGSESSRRSLLENIHLMEPFNMYPDLAREIALELLKNDLET